MIQLAISGRFGGGDRSDRKLANPPARSVTRVKRGHVGPGSVTAPSWWGEETGEVMQRAVSDLAQFARSSAKRFWIDHRDQPRGARCRVRTSVTRFFPQSFVRIRSRAPAPGSESPEPASAYATPKRGALGGTRWPGRPRQPEDRPGLTARAARSDGTCWYPRASPPRSRRARPSAGASLASIPALFDGEGQARWLPGQRLSADVQFLRSHSLGVTATEFVPPRTRGVSRSGAALGPESAQ